MSVVAAILLSQDWKSRLNYFIVHLAIAGIYRIFYLLTLTEVVEVVQKLEMYEYHNKLERRHFLIVFQMNSAYLSILYKHNNSSFLLRN